MNMQSERAQEIVAPEQSENEEQKIADNEPDMSPNETRARAHGWSDMETFVENGGDAENWKGAAAYNQFHDIVKKGDETNKSLKNQMEKLTTGFAEMTRKQQAQHKVALDKALVQAKADLDVEAVAAISGQLSEIEEQPAQQQQQQPREEPNIIQNFRQENGVLDSGKLC